MSSEHGSSGATIAPSAASPRPVGANGTNGRPRKTEQVEAVTIRFAGDSGDGMQLAGTQFTNTSALAGNDIATSPHFPPAIRGASAACGGWLRAPAGPPPGVSGFQVHFSASDIHTPGDDLDALVVMNPAA